jgi:hypothetical protein
MQVKILELEKILVLIFTLLSSWTGWRVLPSWTLIFFQDEESDFWQPSGGHEGFHLLALQEMAIYTISLEFGVIPESSFAKST